MRRQRWRRSLGLTLTVALVGAVAAIGFATSNAARSQAASTHRQDRLLLQRTLAGLVSQHVRFALRDVYTFSSTGSWSLTPDDAADKARLEGFVKQSAVYNHGAALVNLSGQRLTFFAEEPGLPPRSDKGYVPMVRDLLAGKSGLSSVMRIGGVDVVAAAVPVEVGGARVALLLGFSRIAESQFQSALNVSPSAPPGTATWWTRKDGPWPPGGRSWLESGSIRRHCRGATAGGALVSSPLSGTGGSWSRPTAPSA